MLGTALLCLALRCSLLGVPYENETHLIPTHLRIDSLFFGVLLGYLHHRDPGLLIRGLPTRLLLGGLGALLVLPAFVLELQTSRYLYTLGFSALYLGNGLLLIAFLPGRFGGWFGRGAAAIGRHSYSIYLWHFPIRNLVEDHHAQLELSPGSSIALYLGGSLAVGIVGSKAIEVPILRLRDRLYPTRSGSLDVEGAATADHARPSARCAPPDGEPET